jgi:serine/threonine protein kinase
VTLVPGTRLGPYEVVSALGAGGMGEVYRARDTKLGRDVALKILPAAFTTDAERLVRFRREESGAFKKGLQEELTVLERLAVRPVGSLPAVTVEPPASGSPFPKRAVSY